MIIAIDFDGTCVEHWFPAVGANVPFAVETLRKWVSEGHKLILYTMRSDNYMDDALNWFEKNCIPLWGVNENPQQSEWTTSNKVYAEAYVDDAAVGCPLIWTSSRPYVDWLKVDQILFGNFEGERSFEPVPFISEEDLPKDK